MWEEIRKKLTAWEAETRKGGWEQLHKEVAHMQFFPDGDQLEELLRRQAQEDDQANWRLSVNALIQVALRRPARAANSPLVEQPVASLGEWLWEPFLKESLVLRVVDPNSRRRDEDAVIVLARHLSLRDFPRTQFEGVLHEKADWGLVPKSCGALCVVGRLGLYGPHALEHWVRPQSRFSFIAEHRPKDLKRGQLDSQHYHCIRERQRRAGPAKYREHPTTDEDGRRIDYGIVQRYVVPYQSSRLVLLFIAGGSSLGTLGAVQWMAGDTRPDGQRPEKDRIPLAPKAGDDSRLEVLLRVTAQNAAFPSSWRGTRPELVGLHVDDWVWSPEENSWHQMGPEEIALILDRKQPAEVAAVEFDGDKLIPRKDTQSFRLLVRVCQQARASGGLLDVTALAEDASIWDGGTAKELEKAGEALSLLKSRQLHDALTTDHRRLLARVTERTQVEV